MDFRSQIKESLVTHFHDWDDPSKVIRLLKTPNHQVADPLSLLQKTEYFEKLKTNLRKYAPNILRLMKDKTTLNLFLSQLLEELELSHIKTGGNVGITYYSLESGEEMKSKDEFPHYYDPFLSKIPALNLETLVNLGWFPTTRTELLDGEDIVYNDDAKKELIAEPGTTSTEINFFNYFSIIPGKEVLPLVSRDDNEHLPDGYPFAKSFWHDQETEVKTNINESNYLQYTAPISVSDNLGELLETFNQKWGLLRPTYLKRGREEDDLRGRGYYGGLTASYQYNSVIDDKTLAGNFMLHWSYDLLARLSFAKKNGGVDLSTSPQIIDELMELIYRPQPWGRWKCRKVSANTTMKGALAILGGFNYSLKPYDELLRRKEGRVFSFFEKLVLNGLLTPKDFRKFYFHPEYSTEVFLLRNQEKIDNYHQKIEPLFEKLFGGDEEVEELDLVDVLPVLEFIFSYGARHQKVLFGDILRIVGENINPEEVEALIESFPKMIAYLPDEYLENLQPDLVQEIVIGLAKGRDSDHFADFLREQLDNYNREELNTIIAQAPRAINYLSQEKWALLEIETLVTIFKEHLPKEEFLLKSLKPNSLRLTYYWPLPIKHETFQWLLKRFSTPEELFQLLSNVPNASLALEDNAGEVLLQLDLQRRLELLGRLSLGTLPLDDAPIVHKLRDTIVEKADLEWLAKEYPKVIGFLSPVQLEKIGAFELDRYDLERIKSNLSRTNPSPEDFSLTTYSPQSSQFTEIARESRHAITRQTPDSITKAREILGRTDLSPKEQALAYYPQVPTIYQRRLDEFSNQDKYGRAKYIMNFDRERQLAELDQLSSEMSSELSSDRSSEILRPVFKIEGDLEKRKEIIDFFHSGVSGSDRFKVDQIYQIRVPELVEKWEQRPNQSDNLKLLWHGTGKGNLMSIMQGGLKMPERGGMFGRGIYFAPLSLKSMGYSDQMRYSCSQGSRDQREGWLLYNIVDMGRVDYPTRIGQPAWTIDTSASDFDSLHAKAGTLGLQMDEMVIYDPSRVLTTHLVKIKCN